MKTTRGLIGAAMLLAMAPHAYAQDESTFTPEQQQQIGKIAADYLVKHPEVLIKASQALQAKQQQQAQQQQAQVNENAIKLHDRLLQLEGVPQIGPADAKVTVTEFFDYQCFYCNKMAPEIEQLIKDNPDVKFVFRDWPIFAERWPTSATAAYQGLAIWKEQGASAYINYHNGIYETGHNEGKLTDDDIAKIAKEATGDEAPKASAAAYKAVIDRNDQLAQDLGFTGTPGFVVTPAKAANADNTTAIGGAVPAAALQQAIDQAKKN